MSEDSVVRPSFPLPVSSMSHPSPTPQDRAMYPVPQRVDAIPRVPGAYAWRWCLAVADTIGILTQVNT